MRVYQIVAASMLAGAALGAVSVGGLNAQVKSPGAYAVVAFNEISDPAGFKTNVSDKAPEAVKKHGGNFIVRTDNITVLRPGEPPIKRYIVIGFDNAQKAKDWYNSQDMKNLNEYNNQHTKGRAFIVDAVNQ